MNPGCHDHQNIEEHESRSYICTVLEIYITTLTENNLVNDPVRTATAAAFTRHDMKTETLLLNSMKHRSPCTDTFTLKLDELTMSITDRFDQHDYNIYMNSEGLLLKTANGEDATSDHNLTRLRNSMDIFHSSYTTRTPPNIWQ